MYWRYIVQNIGNVPLTHITVHDDRIGTICSGLTLHPGEVTICNASGTAIEGQYANRATVTGYHQGTAYSDSDMCHYFGRAVADLAIEKSGPAQAVAGEALTYTVVVRNRGPSDARNVVVRETYPACFLFSSATPPPTSGNNVWAFAVIPAGETRTLTITGTVSSGCTDDLVNRVEVRSDTHDPVPGNNSYTLTTPLATRADLEVTKSGPAQAVAGEALTYTVVVRNRGPSDARNVVV
ncbi:MAG: DUF11 domain-containing protein, partial [Candidatus Bipolaricaulaceae bacterium]